MSSFQDKAQHQISQLDKEVCPPCLTYMATSYTRLSHSFSARSSENCQCAASVLTSRRSFPNILPSTISRSRPLFRKSTSSSDSLACTSSSYSSTSPVAFSSTLPVSLFPDTILSTPSLVQARLMIHRYVKSPNSTMCTDGVEVFANGSIVVDSKFLVTSVSAWPRD